MRACVRKRNLEIDCANGRSPVSTWTQRPILDLRDTGVRFFQVLSATFRKPRPPHSERSKARQKAPAGYRRSQPYLSRAFCFAHVSVKEKKNVRISTETELQWPNVRRHHLLSWFWQRRSLYVQLLVGSFLTARRLSSACPNWLVRMSTSSE